MELLALHKKDVHSKQGNVGLPGTKTVRAKREVPFTDDAKNESSKTASQMSLSRYIL